MLVTVNDRDINSIIPFWQHPGCDKTKMLLNTTYLPSSVINARAFETNGPTSLWCIFARSLRSAPVWAHKKYHIEQNAQAGLMQHVFKL